MKNRIRCLALIGLLAASLAPSILHGETSRLDPALFPEPHEGAVDLGLVFNVNDILFDVESYQAGLGMKIGWREMALRCLFDLVANSSTQIFSATVGAAYQYYLLPGAIRPYIGGSAELGFMNQAHIVSMPMLTLGVIAGIEVFLLDFVSVFVEYAATADLALSIYHQTSQVTFDFLIDTGMGNNSRIGVVLYLMRIKKH